ncbi:pilin [Wenzhouxiangella sediminis]|uniref:Prepilin-type N-terminal cleavage/methylation domain-containing protein n=1 Tax=Wenzhouxiangella sediminis TaxID=1792836 RepID=A0A3E1K4T0_9GAMM|nr:pilin [Wenzhouxiangella sediminis]RFF28896.1 prepilin-type N-terminal cleavage/methylation domain-containing protein [Wenzhouxiangella sediminis]
MNQTKNHGFTLIELMIVIAVLAILVAIAMPTYEQFTIRARVSEGVYAAAPVKLAVAEAVSANQSPTPTNTGHASQQSEYVDAVELANDGSGVITVTTRNTGATPDPVITLSPTIASDGGITWLCELRAGDARYVPPNCRTP